MIYNIKLKIIIILLLFNCGYPAVSTRNNCEINNSDADIKWMKNSANNGSL